VFWAFFYHGLDGLLRIARKEYGNGESPHLHPMGEKSLNHNSFIIRKIRVIRGFNCGIQDKNGGHSPMPSGRPARRDENAFFPASGVLPPRSHPAWREAYVRRKPQLFIPAGITEISAGSSRDSDDHPGLDSNASAPRRACENRRWHHGRSIPVSQTLGACYR
jgi:hypothetical protein